MKETVWFKKRNTGEAGGDFMLVASLVIILGIFWVFSGGADKASTSTVNFNAKESIFSGVSNFFPPVSQGDSSTSKADAEYARIVEEFGRTRDFGETSPYWGQVRIQKTSNGPRETSPLTEYVELSTAYSLTAPVSLTGWKLQSMISNEVVSIPKATKISTSGTVNIEQPLMAGHREKIYLLTGHSPTGVSFQINKCSGYFEQFQDFTPSIQKQCPLPEDEFRFSESDPLRFGDACLSYIEDLDRCSMPLEALPLGFSDSCAVFITEEIHYSSCVENHRNDSDFFSPEWRVYLKHDREIWGSRDIIRLLDADGKTVDVFNY
ncbi:MAG: hypothetical protein WD509_01125 [Candidatus Paceibacterota bacterium]